MFSPFSPFQALSLSSRSSSNTGISHLNYPQLKAPIVHSEGTYAFLGGPWRAVFLVCAIWKALAVSVHSDVEMLRVEESKAAIPISKGRHR